MALGVQFSRLSLCWGRVRLTQFLDLHVMVDVGATEVSPINFMSLSSIVKGALLVSSALSGCGAMAGGGRINDIHTVTPLQ